jgi:hypothetical protein
MPTARPTSGKGAAMHAELLAGSRLPSLAQTFREYGERWEIEKVPKGVEWIAVLRETSGDYIRIVAAHDIAALRFRMNDVEREKPEERESAGTAEPGRAGRVD